MARRRRDFIPELSPHTALQPEVGRLPRRHRPEGVSQAARRELRRREGPPLGVCVLDEAHLWNAVRYVERNPVRAGIVDRAEDYKWSSAAAHCGLREDPVLSGDLPLIGAIKDWSEWLSVEQPADELNFIRERTHSGRPCSSDEFARELEKRVGQPQLRRKPGPPQRLSTDTTDIDADQKSLGFE